MAAKKPAPLEKGRQAYEQRDHLRAFEELSAADRAEPLFGPDLERLGKSAGLLGRDEEYLKAFERAHHLCLEAGDNVSAARTTFWLGARLMGGGERSRAAGWFARGQRLLDECGEDCVERGYFLIPASRRQLSREGDRYVVIADDQRYTAKQVVVAMATYQKPRVPEFARELDRGIVQLHSIGYRNPSQFKEGAVLIVGAGNSRSEIALEAARATGTRRGLRAGTPATSRFGSTACRRGWACCGWFCEASSTAS